MNIASVVFCIFVLASTIAAITFEIKDNKIMVQEYTKALTNCKDFVETQGYYPVWRAGLYNALIIISVILLVYYMSGSSKIQNLFFKMAVLFVIIWVISSLVIRFMLQHLIRAPYTVLAD